WHVLQAVNGQVDLLAQQRVLDLLDENARTPVGAGLIGRLAAVAAGRDGHDLDLQLRMRLDQRARHERGLRAGQRAAACSEPDHARAHAASRSACSHAASSPRTTSASAAMKSGAALGESTRTNVSKPASCACSRPATSTSYSVSR